MSSKKPVDPFWALAAKKDEAMEKLSDATKLCIGLKKILEKDILSDKQNPTEQSKENLKKAEEAYNIAFAELQLCGQNPDLSIDLEPAKALHSDLGDRLCSIDLSKKM